MAALSRRHLATLAVAAAAGGAGWLLWQGGATGAPAPRVDYPLISGQPLAASALDGKVVLVNFWATSCSTCVAEMPELVQTWQRFQGRGYQTVAVAMAYDPIDYVRSFASTRGLPFPVAHDGSGKLAQEFGRVALTPTSILIDRRGREVKRYLGRPDMAELHALIDRLLVQS